MFAGLTGTLFGTVSTNPWLYFAMANLLVLAALAILDVIPIQLPAGLAQRAATAGPVSTTTAAMRASVVGARCVGLRDM